jgi:hypothetical protein
MTKKKDIVLDHFIEIAVDWGADGYLSVNDRTLEGDLSEAIDQTLEKVLEEVELEIEAWMDVHEEMQKSFQTDDLMKHLRKSLKDK